MNGKKILAGWDCLTCARWLVIAELVSLFISTSLTSVIEVLLFAAVLLCAGRLRDKIVLAIRQPIVVMALLFGGVLCLGLFYGPAPLAEKLATLKGWRKLLLLPLAVLLFDEIRWKQRLTLAVIGVAVVYMSWSFWGFLGHGATIVVHNHATQGMFFAVAAFAAVVLFFSESKSASPIPRWPLLTSAALLVTNTVFVTTGRSGYLALLVLSAVAPFMLFRGKVRVALAVCVPLTITVLLAFSPTATERVTVGIRDMRHYEQAEQYTDMGIRMVMWKNTVQVIQAHPFFGHGLGGLPEAYRKQVEGVTGWQGIVVDDPHNQYLKVTAELGVVGLLVFLGFIGSFFRQDVPMPYRLLGLGALLAWCATSLFSGHFGTSGEGRFIMLWAGAQLAMVSFPEAGGNG